MKWETLQGDARELAGKISIGELSAVEALRAIAEQLEDCNSELVVIAAELIKRNETESSG